MSLQSVQLTIGWIALLVEHSTGIAEVMALNPVQVHFFFSGFLFSTAKVEYIAAINVHLLKNFSHSANVCNFIHSLHIKHLYLSDKPLNTVNYPRPRKFYKTLRKTLECTHSSSASSL